MKRYINILLLSVIVFASCDTSIPVTSGIDNFEVTTDSTSYKAGEEVYFNIKGSPDMITFYSGEVLHEYSYRDGRKIQLNDAILSFSTSKPATASAQVNQFKVVVSTDFNGDYTHFSNVESATWIDITNRFTLATSVTFIPSGSVDISDLIEEGRPLYVGFKYIAYPMEQGKVGTWHVQSFSFLANSAIGPLALGDMTTSGFRIVEQNPETAVSRSTMTATRITLLGYVATEENNIQTETWAISKAFEVGEIDKGPDRPIAIKGVESVPMDVYSYIYTQPGTYKATFVATNANASGSVSVARELEVTIVP